MALPSMSDTELDEVGYAYVTNTAKLWDGGIVRFSFKMDYFEDYDGQMVLEQLFSDEEMKVIEGALKHIEDNVPCLDFR